MTAVAADEFRVALASRNVTDSVRREEADERMPDFEADRLALQKGMAARARVFNETVTLCHTVDVMAEKAARVTHLLVKCCAPDKSILPGVKDQRVSTPDADVFVMSLPVRQGHIRVMTEEAGERVADTGDRPILRQIVASAAALPAVTV